MTVSLSYGRRVSDLDWAIDLPADVPKSFKISLAAGDSVVYRIANEKPITIRAIPGIGATAMVQSSTSLQTAISAGSAEWRDWVPTTYSDYSEAVLTGPITGLKFSSADAGTIFEVTV